jgi:hypothetical protein
MSTKAAKRSSVRSIREPLGWKDKMTRTVPFTQASIGRAVKAARKVGLRVTGISATGTVLVQEADEPLATPEHPVQTRPPSKWGNVQA